MLQYTDSAMLGYMPTMLIFKTIKTVSEIEMNLKSGVVIKSKYLNQITAKIKKLNPSTLKRKLPYKFSL